jgi:glycosyltransferase involved in cell wall biosynthesis
LVDLAPARLPKFSVVIPTMNEPLIQSLVDKVHFELGFVDHEVVVVDS